MLGVAAAVLLGAFESMSESKTPLTSIEILIEQDENQLFINKNDILKVLANQDDSLELRNINAINTALLEESLENHAFIAEAEVFSTLDGLLSVQVEQKLAIARVIHPAKHYYLDAEGHPFPSTKNYSATVPVFTGKTDSTSNYASFSLLNTINTVGFFKGWLAEVHTTANSEIELIPLRGRHRVIFGKNENALEKLKKLKAFYSTVVTEENLDDWKTLNVAYTKLLVSTKH